MFDTKTQYLLITYEIVNIQIALAVVRAYLFRTRISQGGSKEHFKIKSPCESL